MVKKGKRSYQYLSRCRTGCYIDNLLLRKEFVINVTGNSEMRSLLPAGDLPVNSRVL